MRQQEINAVQDIEPESQKQLFEKVISGELY